MKIGNLNEYVQSFSYHFANTQLIPQPLLEGDPTKKQPLHLYWKQIRDEEVALELPLEKPCFIDTVTLTLGPKTALLYAQVLDGERVLYTYCAETDQQIKTSSLELRIGAVCQKLSVILSANFTTLQLEALTLYGAVEEGPDLFPTPEAVTVTGSTVSLSAFTGIHAGESLGQQAAARFQRKLAAYTDMQLPLTESGNISFLLDSTVPENGYRLHIDSTCARITAADLRGLVMGGETFIKLIRDKTVPETDIEDKPFKSFRGVHLFIPSMESMDFAKRLIEHLISPVGYNTVILQVSGGMIYERHPKISESFAHAVSMHSQGWPAFPHNGIAEGKPITKAQLKQYINFIRSFGIDVIPEVQSLAHVQYLTHAYPEIAEIAQEEINEHVDTRQEDMLPSKFYHHDYCPSNPRTYEILFDVLDEIIEVFEPREYVHMGHDEVRSIGVCPACKGKTPAELFAYDINKIHGYLASKGLKMMIWADMLQPMPKYPTHPAIDRIPKDIVLLDFIWYFHLDKDIENNLLEKDFKVLFGNLYSSHFPRYESRIRQEGIDGGQISAWVATNEYEMQKEGKLYDFMMTAQLLWAESYRSQYRLCYDRLLQAMIPVLRENLQGRRYPSRLPGAKRVTLGENTAAFPPALPLAQQEEFTVDGCFDSLVFHHTALRRITREPWLELSTVAKYVITYADGQTEQIPVTYGGNIGWWNRRQNDPLPHAFYRHTGYTATYHCDSITTRTAQGEPVTTYLYEYIPSRREKIASVRLEQDPAFTPHILLQKLEGICK